MSVSIPGLHHDDRSHPKAQGALLTVLVGYYNGPAGVVFLGWFSQRTMDRQFNITITIQCLQLAVGESRKGHLHAAVTNISA